MPGQSDLVIGTAGHIDHGKTAIVRALTGVDTDRLPAEKRRGITIDIGFASMDVGSRTVALVDVPGHERFIRNMLAGATGLDLALLVVAADDSVMPQTREHLEILRLLGLSGGVIALTKCDLADSTWLGLVEEEVRGLVAGTFLESAEVVRTSTHSGLGISELTAAIRRLCDSTADRPDPGPFRMAIDRSFTVAGHGTVVTGTVASGSVGVGEELEWLPIRRSVKVRGLHRHDRPVDRVARGARAAINLGGVHHLEVRRGHELAEPGYLIPSSVLTVELTPSPDVDRPLRHRSRYRVHLGTAEVTGSLSLLEPSSGRGLAQLILAEPVASVHGQPFVIREESPPATLGGGRVLEPVAGRIRRRDVATIDRVARLASTDPSTRLTAAIARLGLDAWTPAVLSRACGLTTGEVGPAVESLEASGKIVSLPVGPRRATKLLAEVAADLETRVLRALARLHEANPRLSAIARAKVVSRLADLKNDPLVSAVIDRLRASGRVIAEGRTVALVGHEPKLSHRERKLEREIAESYRAGGFTPPDASEWLARGASVGDLFDLLRDQDRLVEIGPGMYLDREAEVEMRRRLADRLSDGSSLTMAELRDLLGTSRKFAVPIGEYLDRAGVTVRVGDLRTLGNLGGSSE